MDSGSTDGLAHLVRVVGQVTADRHLDALIASAEALSQCGARSQVIEYSETRLLMTPDQMVSNVLAAAKAVGPVHIPAAIVFPPDQFQHWKAYAEHMGHHGILRGLFTGPDALAQAVAWAKRMEPFGDPGRHLPPRPPRSRSAGGRTPAPSYRR